MPLSGPYTAALAVQAHSEPLRHDLDTLVAALRSRPGAARDQLLAAPVADDLRRMFARARADDANPFALPLDVVFPDGHYPIQTMFSAGEQIALTIEDAAALQVLRQVVSGEWRDLPEHHEARGLAEELRQLGALVDQLPKLDCERPGIYRLQHASVLYRSASGTSIVVDPVSGLDEPGWISPLAIAPDAVHIDTTGMPIGSVVDQVMGLVRSRF